MRRVFCLALLALFACACQPAALPPPRSAADADFIQRAEASPTVFRIPKEQAEETMARAQSYLGLVSRLKIQTATAYLVETFGDATGNPITTYRVVRRDDGAESEISVFAGSSNEFWVNAVRRNQQLLAYYLRTGEMNKALAFP